VNATNYVRQDVFKSIDAKTGRPTYFDDKKPDTGKKASFCPSLWGGKDWPSPVSYTVDGKQYIAVASGWGVDAQFQQGLLSNLLPGWDKSIPEGGVIWAFAVE